MNNLQKIIVTYLLKNPESTGYEITSYLSNKTKHSHQQVYRELRSMAKAGVTFLETIPQTGKPDKVIYTMCDGPDIDCFKATNFDKTETACSMVVGEINGNKGLFQKYIDHMKKADLEFREAL